MYVCGYVCMVFGIISRTKARSATNEIPKCRSPERALLRHIIIGVRLLTSARRREYEYVFWLLQAGEPSGAADCEKYLERLNKSMTVITFTYLGHY